MRILRLVDFTIAGFWVVRNTKETLPKFLYGWSVLMFNFISIGLVSDSVRVSRYLRTGGIGRGVTILVSEQLV